MLAHSPIFILINIRLSLFTRTFVEQQIFYGPAQCLFGQETRSRAGITLHWHKDNRRQRSNPKGLGNLFFVVHIHLININFPRILGSKLVEHRCETTARAAPVCIKIDDGGLVAKIVPHSGRLFEIDNFFKKSSLVQFYGLALERSVGNLRQKVARKGKKRKK